MKTLTKAEVASLFNHARNEGYVRRYQKTATVLARRSAGDELIETRLGDELETSKVTQPGDVVVKNHFTQFQEEQVVNPTKFAKLYKNPENLTDDWTEFEVNPEAPRYAFKYQGESVLIETPWGGTMPLNPGDFVQSLSLVADAEAEDYNVYRVHGGVFPQTFSTVPMS